MLILLRILIILAKVCKKMCKNIFLSIPYYRYFSPAADDFATPLSAALYGHSYPLPF